MLGDVGALLSSECAAAGGLGLSSFMNAGCHSLAISKLLGVGIVVGAMGVKLPQIMKVLGATSAAGLSLLTHVLELVNFAIVIAYSTRVLQAPFNTYGEYLFIGIQNLVLVYLLFKYGEAPGGVAGFAAVVAAYGLFAYALLGDVNGAFFGATNDRIAFLQTLTIPINIAGRVPQIVQTFRAKSAGQLALLTWLLNFLGSTARVFTTYKEAGGDVVLLAGYAIGAILNGTIMAQILFYGSADKKKQQ